MFNCQYCKILLVASLLFFFSAEWAHAQFGDSDAFTPTKSNDLIAGQLTLPTGEDFRFSVRDGQWLRVTDDESGKIVAYQAKALSDTEVTLTEFEIKKIRRGNLIEGEAVKFTGETFDLISGSELLIPSNGFRLSLDSIHRHPSQDNSDPSLTPFERNYGTKAVCCVTCGGTTVCGGSVDSACGQCCSGKGCGLVLDLGKEDSP